MATILAHIRVREGTEATFEEVAAALYDATHAHETGVRRYEYWRGQEPRTYYSLLAFDDYLAFLAHQTSDHHEAAIAPLREVLEDIRLEWVDPLPGASPLPATAAQDFPDDADEAARRMAKLFAAEVAGWWPGPRG